MRIEEEIKSNFRNERHKAVVNLMYTNYQMMAQMRDFFKPYDVTLQQFNILRILRGQHPNPASIGLIKERMLDKSSDVSRIIDRLLLKQYIDRRECKTDRRQKDIIISPTGLELLNKIDNADMQRESMMNKLSEEEATEFNRLLDKVRS